MKTNKLVKFLNRYFEFDSKQHHTQNKINDYDHTIHEFHNSIQTSIDWKELQNVEFAMWFKSELDSIFTKSEIVEKWNQIYSLISHYRSYIIADLLMALKLTDNKLIRIDLPDSFQAFAFLTKDNEQVILSLSKEKGIRFHFASSTSVSYINQFLDNFVSYCKVMNRQAELNSYIKDNNISLESWWELTLETSKVVEENEALTSVGKIIK